MPTQTIDTQTAHRHAKGCIAGAGHEGTCVTLAAADVVQATQDIWNCMLGLDLAPLAVEAAAIPEGLRGAVALRGTFAGDVVVQAPLKLAQRAAIIMLGAETVTPEEINDSLGEITNMVAGGVKGLLPGIVQLSLPRVSDSSAPKAGDGAEGADGEIVTSVCLLCEGQPLWIRVLRTGVSD